MTLPLACVLTIAGSGSEMNGGMVLTNEQSNRKIGIGNKRLQPAVSILDPVSTFTVSPQQTAYGAVDTVAHLVEFYCTTEAVQTEPAGSFDGGSGADGDPLLRKSIG